MDAFVKRLPKPQGDRGNNARDNPPASPVADQRPSKRMRRKSSRDFESEQSDSSSPDKYDKVKDAIKKTTNDEDNDRQSHCVTEFESALPPTQIDQEAINQYEALRSSQEGTADNNESTEKSQTTWVKGKSSIYVDAFNLALDTVLDEESHLFDNKEMEVFDKWRKLDYEAKFLYVRLFLRKTASWHRQSRLEYHNDIADMETAINTLQNAHDLSPLAIEPTSSPIQDVDIDEFNLGDRFAFADASGDHIQTVEEAASLLSLDELKALAKEAKFQGRNKPELIKSLTRMSQQQIGLMALGLSRHNSRESLSLGHDANQKPGTDVKPRREDHNRKQHFLEKILSILGPCVRLSQQCFKLFERVHLVFYRSTEWSEKSLTTIILAKMTRRVFPEYIVCRSALIFASRMHLLEFETAIRLESDVDCILEFGGPPGQEGFRKIIDIFDKLYPRWKILLEEEKHKEKTLYEMGEGVYLRRFTPGHSYTRIVHKAAHVYGKLKEYLKEYELLTELLDQRLFQMARRGGWYQRKALLEEHYMPDLDPNPVSTSAELQKKHWKRIAVSTCEAGLQDPHCHLIFHYDLQKRLVKLEKKLRIPKRLQHDFGHVALGKPIEHYVEGVQLKREIPAKPGRQASTKTIWLNKLDDTAECSVEDMCLSHYQSQGWKGYHSEGGIIRTLFAYLFYDILFLYIPNVFQTAYQTCPLDLHTDAFFPARVSEINHRLVEIANGEGGRLVRQVWDKEHEQKTSVIGLNWDFDIEDLVELVECFGSSALAAVCKVMAQEYRQRGGGIPDLILWRVAGETGEASENPGRAKGDVMFAEVKSANDRLSDTQRLWIHVLTGAGVKVALCNAVAKEVREVG